MSNSKGRIEVFENKYIYKQKNKVEFNLPSQVYLESETELKSLALKHFLSLVNFKVCEVQITDFLSQEGHC